MLKNLPTTITRSFLVSACAVIAACGGSSDSCSLFGTCGYNDGGSSTLFRGAPACNAIGYKGVQKVANGEECSITSSADSSSVAKLVIYKGNVAFVCTGTVVSPTTVLTAAHCFGDGASAVNIVTTVNGKQSTVTSRSWSIHPQWGVSDSVMFNDVAVVYASRRLSAPITPILLSRSPAEAEESLVAGYGQTEHAGSVSANANAGRAIIQDVSDNHIYINYTPSQAHPCKGDSGGALFVANGNGIAVVGVVSQSDPSVDPDNICEVGDRTLYTNVRDPSVAAFIRASIPDAKFQ